MAVAYVIRRDGQRSGKMHSREQVMKLKPKAMLQGHTSANKGEFEGTQNP